MKLKITLASLLVMLLLPANKGMAAEKAEITISPFLQDIRFTPSEGTKSFTVKISNNSKSAKTFNLSVLDFGSLDATGGLVFAGSNAGTLVKKYGLSNWLTTNIKEVTVEPKKSAEIKATIIDDASMTPGGHYAAIVASVVEANNHAQNNISVNQKITSLVLATKVGGEKYDLRLKSIGMGSTVFSLPKDVQVNFYNPGNVHVVPRGIVQVITPNGIVVSRGVINEESGYVLPETSRTFTVRMNVLATKAWYPGVYKVKATYRYDGIEKYAVKNRTIIYLSVTNLLIVAGTAALSYLIAKKLRKSDRFKYIILRVKSKIRHKK